jgi:tetratricopeptide (TPR) repeat protein
VLPWSCPGLELLPTEDVDGDLLLLGCNGWLTVHGPDLPLHRWSIAQIEAAAGPGSPHLLESLESLSWALVQRERSEEALIHARRAHAISGGAGSDSGNRLAEALNTLGFVELELGQSEAARSNLEAALGLLDAGVPDADRLARDIHYNLGSVFYATGQWDAAEGQIEDAERMARMAVKNDTAAYSSDHEEVAADLRLLAEVLRAAERTEEAREVEARITAPSSDSTAAPASHEGPSN